MLVGDVVEFVVHPGYAFGDVVTYPLYLLSERATGAGILVNALVENRPALKVAFRRCPEQFFQRIDHRRQALYGDDSSVAVVGIDSF